MCGSFDVFCCRCGQIAVSCICYNAYNITTPQTTHYTQTGRIKDASIPGEYIREGLTAVVSVTVAEPEFEGQTKTRLGTGCVQCV